MGELISYIKKHEDSIYLDFYDRYISIDPSGDNHSNVLLYYYFDNIDSDLYDEDDLHDESFILNEIINGKIEITTCCLRYWVEYDEKTKEIPLVYSRSIENIRFFLLREYYNTFKKITSFNIGYPDDSYCSSYIELKYIEIDFLPIEHFNLVAFYEKITELKNRDVGLRPISFRNQKYERRVSNERSVSIISTNTKTRRIGYLKEIIELFENGSYYPLKLLPIRLERVSQESIEDLQEYEKVLGGSNKGMIKEGFNGNSAKPYVELLKGMNLLTEINRTYVLTKQVKWYFEINKERHVNQGFFKINRFELNSNDCLFFLETILRTDILFSGSVLQLAKILGEEFKTKDIYPLLKTYLINIIKPLSSGVENNRKDQKLSEILHRINSWEKDEKYAEHIVEPRINWFLDLRIISVSSKKGYYKFSDIGNRFLNVLSGISESLYSGWLDNVFFIESSYLSAFNYIYNFNSENTWYEPKVLRHLNQSMKIFKTDAPRRIAASQGINYTCAMSMLKDKCVINYGELKKYLLDPKNSYYLLDWFNTENDGSLTQKL